MNTNIYEMFNFCFQPALLEQYADACRMRCEVLIHLDRPAEALHWSRLATQYKPGEVSKCPYTSIYRQSQFRDLVICQALNVKVRQCSGIFSL